ncbi:MAG TPA: hypothetical protein VH643_25385 [Gemmataceae bacterium]
MLTHVRQQDDARQAELDAERTALERDLLRGQGELRKLLAEVSVGESNGRLVSRLAQMQERVGHLEQRITRLRGQLETLQQERWDEDEAGRALAGLDPAWPTMTPKNGRGSWACWCRGWTTTGRRARWRSPFIPWV